MKTITIFDDITEKTLEQIAHSIDGMDEGEELTLQICSSGGYVFYAFGIIDLFKSHSLRVVAEIYGMAASAAAIIALACNRVKMASFGSLMLHSAFSPYGEEDAGVERANDLQLEIIRSRNPSYTLSDLKIETWFGARKALEMGFADEIISDSREIAALSKKYAASISLYSSSNSFHKGDSIMEDEKVKKPCEAAEEMPEGVEVKEEVSSEDILEKAIEKLSEHDNLLEEILHRLSVLEGEGKKVDDIEEDNSEEGVFARRKALYAKISQIASPKASMPAKVKSEPKKSKIDLTKFLH